MENEKGGSDKNELSLSQLLEILSIDSTDIDTKKIIIGIILKKFDHLNK
jgi:hypothetical protein